jgi:hypothetical protein
MRGLLPTNGDLTTLPQTATYIEGRRNGESAAKNPDGPEGMLDRH